MREKREWQCAEFVEMMLMVTEIAHLQRTKPLKDVAMGTIKYNMLKLLDSREFRQLLKDFPGLNVGLLKMISFELRHAMSAATSIFGAMRAQQDQTSVPYNITTLRPSFPPGWLLQPTPVQPNNPNAAGPNAAGPNAAGQMLLVQMLLVQMLLVQMLLVQMLLVQMLLFRMLLVQMLQADREC